VTAPSAFHPDPETRTPVVIIGAGPAGLRAAEILSAAGLPVEVHDRMPSPARKFLMAGRGGLNLTHSEPVERFSDRYGAASPTVMDWLGRFGPDDMTRWSEALGQPTFVGSSGRVFPNSMKASPLLRAWLQRLRERGVVLHSGSNWVGFEGGAPVFERAGERQTRLARALVVATGGASWPRLGSDGRGLDLLSGLGVVSRAFQPANVGARVDWSPEFVAAHAGQPLKAVALTIERRRVRGEAMVVRLMRMWATSRIDV